ncbi:hypothetical protein CP09DC79_0833A, partial [Chlamydia psittaci 09DC79]
MSLELLLLKHNV